MTSTGPIDATPVATARFSLVTLNAWRLRESHRVPLLLDALRVVGRALEDAPDGGEPPAPPRDAAAPGDHETPDVVAFQELESPAATDELRALLEPTHWFRSCVCAHTLSGAPRSAVGAALRRSTFEVLSHECVPLGALWPDHKRCALAVRARHVATGAELDLVSVHLSSRPANAAQAARLVEELRARGVWDAPTVVVTGDLNVPPGAAAYRHLASGPLRDPYEKDRGPTHWFGRRIDHVLVGPAVELVRPLDQGIAREAVRQCVQLDPFGRARSSVDAPVSDHVPEGGVFRVTRSLATSTTRSSSTSSPSALRGVPP